MEIAQCDDINVRKWCFLQDIEVPVVGDKIARTCGNGAIDKLVVIWVGSNQRKIVVRSNLLDKRAVENRFHGQFCHFKVEEPLKDFEVFVDDFVGDTQLVFSFDKRLPHRMVAALLRKALDEAVGVEHDFHVLIAFLVKIHLVDFVESVLAEFSRQP